MKSYVSYDDLSQQIMSIFKKDGSDAAVSYLDDCINKNPNFLEAYLVRGEIYTEMGNFQEALNDFEKVIRTDPNIAKAYFLRGLLYAESGSDDNKAFNDFNKAIQLDANDTEAYTNRANICLNLGKFQQAIIDCTKAIELMIKDGKESCEPYYNRGLAYANLDEIEKAIKDYSKVIELAPENAEAKHNLAVCYLNGTGTSQDFKKAVYWLEQASNDGHAGAKTRLGAAYIEGIGVATDKEKGFSLLREAAALGDEKAKDLLRSNEVTNTFLKGGVELGRKGKLIRMAVGFAIGGIIGVILGMNSGYWYIGFLIGAYLGIGTCPFGHHLKEEAGNAWFHTKRFFFYLVSDGNGYDAVANFILGIWYLIKLCFWFVICPFIAIYQLVTEW